MAGLSPPDRFRIRISSKSLDARKNFRTSTAANQRSSDSVHRSNPLNPADLFQAFRFVREWKRACSFQTPSVETFIISRACGQAGPSHSLIFFGGPALIFYFVVAKRTAGKIRVAMRKNCKIDRSVTQRERRAPAITDSISSATFSESSFSSLITPSTSSSISATTSRGQKRPVD